MALSQIASKFHIRHSGVWTLGSDIASAKGASATSRLVFENLAISTPLLSLVFADDDDEIVNVISVKVTLNCLIL